MSYRFIRESKGILHTIEIKGTRMKEKPVILFMCAVGILGLSYGMYRDNDVVFIGGLLFVIAGYLLIRRKLNPI